MGLKITFLNVGYGDAIILEHTRDGCEDDTFTMLIDGGSNEKKEYEGDSGRITAYDYLLRAGITKLDVVLNTHIHEDHTSGLEPIITRFPISAFWYVTIPEAEGKIIPEHWAVSDGNKKFLKALHAAQRIHGRLIEREVPMMEMQQNFSGVQLCEDVFIEVLGPPLAVKQRNDSLMRELFEAKSDVRGQQILSQIDEQMNNVSIMLRLHYKGRSILLAGDTNRDGYEELLCQPEYLRADIFKLGHHGQLDSVTPEILDEIRPSVAVVCASNDLRYGSTNQEVLHMLTAYGERQNKNISILTTDQTTVSPYVTHALAHDAIVIEIDEEGRMDWGYYMNHEILSREQEGSQNDADKSWQKLARENRINNIG